MQSCCWGPWSAGLSPLGILYTGQGGGKGFWVALILDVKWKKKRCLSEIRVDASTQEACHNLWKDGLDGHQSRCQAVQGAWGIEAAQQISSRFFSWVERKQSTGWPFWGGQSCRSLSEAGSNRAWLCWGRSHVEGITSSLCPSFQNAEEKQGQPYVSHDAHNSYNSHRHIEELREVSFVGLSWLVLQKWSVAVTNGGLMGCKLTGEPQHPSEEPLTQTTFGAAFPTVPESSLGKTSCLFLPSYVLWCPVVHREENIFLKRVGLSELKGNVVPNGKWSRSAPFYSFYNVQKLSLGKCVCRLDNCSKYFNHGDLLKVFKQGNTTIRFVSSCSTTEGYS